MRPTRFARHNPRYVYSRLDYPPQGRVRRVESQRQTLFNGPWGLWAVTRVAIANTHTEWEPITPHTEAQKPLLEIIMAIRAVPIGRPRRDKPFDRADFLLISPIQGERCRIVMAPGCREGIHLQGVERDRPKHAVELRGTHGIEEP